jgi:hypothetical protein
MHGGKTSSEGLNMPLSPTKTANNSKNPSLVPPQSMATIVSSLHRPGEYARSGSAYTRRDIGATTVSSLEGVLDRLVDVLSPYRFIDWRTTWFIDPDMEARFIDYCERKRYPWIKWKLLVALVLFLVYCGLLGGKAFTQPPLFVALIDVLLPCSLAWIPAQKSSDLACVQSMRRFWQRHWRAMLFGGVIVYFTCLQFSLHSEYNSAVALNFCTCTEEPCREGILLDQCHQLRVWARAFQVRAVEHAYTVESACRVHTTTVRRAVGTVCRRAARCDAGLLH